MTTYNQAPRSSDIRSTFDRTLLIDFCLIGALWMIGCLIVNPIGEFPLIDDWAFSRDVQHLLETGDYRTLGWGYMSLVTHILWGSLFCLPAGFSFTALRLSSVIAGLIGLYGTYVLVRDMGASRLTSVTVSLSLGVFPGYYVVSYTYMTDVPFAAVAIWSMVFFARSLRVSSVTPMIIGTVLAICAILSRQLALAIPLSFAVCAAARFGLTARTALRALMPFMICLFALLAYNHWLVSTHRSVSSYMKTFTDPLQHTRNLSTLSYEASLSAYFVPLYIGLFLLPVLIAGYRNIFLSDEVIELWNSHKKSGVTLASIAVLLMSLAGCILVQSKERLTLPMHNNGNMLQPFGLGPLSLRDEVEEYGHLAAMPGIFWAAVTFLAIVGALLLFLRICLQASHLMGRILRSERSIGNDESVRMLCVLCGFIYWLPFVSYGFYDRYLILLIPCFAVGVIGKSREPKTTSTGRARSLSFAAGSMLLLCGAISVCGTRDYLTLNRMQWRVLRELMETTHLDAHDIDGSAEFIYYYLYQPDDSNLVLKETYKVGLDVVPGYEVLREWSFMQMFPPHRQKLLLMRRERAGR